MYNWSVDEEKFKNEKERTFSRFCFDSFINGNVTFLLIRDLLWGGGW